MNATMDLGLMVLLSTIVMASAAVTYLMLRQRRARAARRRLKRSAEFWQMKSRACESQWTAHREATTRR